MKLTIVSAYKNTRLALILGFSYIKDNWKLFLISLLLGLLALVFGPKFIVSKHDPVIGLSGDVNISTLPLQIQEEISFGLTQVLPDGQIVPGAAKSWQYSNSGKTVTFLLDTALFWQSGEAFDSQSINYNLKSVQLTRPTKDSVKLELKEPFAPLLTIVSQPLFKNGLVGLGSWQVKNIAFNGRFISSLTLANLLTKEIKTYKFFPNDEAVHLALKLGSVNQAVNLHKTFGLENDRHYSIKESFSPSTIATLFFNLERDTMEDKSIRQGLTYALPDTFAQGSPADSPVPLNNSIENKTVKKYPQNHDLAKKLIFKSASKSAQIKINFAVTPPLEEVAKTIADSWRQIGVESAIEVTDFPSPTYDVFLSYMELPLDPDQYMLWHSTQPGNISHFKSPKVDILLEEGRRTLDPKDRKEIYANFQRAITEDVPATFLFYPRLYTISRI